MKRYTMITLLSLLTAAAAASQPEDGQTNDEIVVSASRAHRPASRMPANVTVITAADINEAGTIDLPEALKALDGIHFRTTSGNASQAQLDMRGFGEGSHGRVLVLLDGRKLNNPDMSGIIWNQIPLNNIERVEVMRGSHTALYGDYAVGGVVNIVTKKGTPEPEYSLSAMGGSYGLNIQRLGVSGSYRHASYSANAERNQSSGYRDRSAYLAWGGGIGLGYDINEWNNAELSLAYNKIEYEMPGYLTREEMRENPRQSTFPDDSAENRFYNVDLGFNSMVSDAVSFKANAAYGRNDSASDMASWSSFSDFIIDRYGVTPRLMVETELFGRENTFLAGFDGYFDRLDAKRYMDLQRSLETADAKIKRQTLGGYINNEFAMVEELGLQLGARLEQARFDAEVPVSGVDDDRTYNAAALSMALIYMLDDDSKLFARAGTAYRFPFVDELVSYAGYIDDIYTDLDMEKGVNYEVGADLGLLENVRGGLTLFALNMKDRIAWNNVTYRNENLDNTRHLGAEARAEWTIMDICRLDAWYTCMQARFSKGDNDGNDVPLVPNHKVSLAANLFLPFDLSLNAVFSYVSPQYLGGDEANTGDKLADYTVVDLGLSYVPDLFSKIGLEAFVGVDNVFGKKYANVGYRGWTTDGYYPAPERSFKAGLSCRF